MPTGPVVAVLNPKGGSGKTTLAVNVATALHRRTRDTGGGVCIVDTDAPQHTAWEWRQTGEDPEPAPGELSERAQHLPEGLQSRMADVRRRPLVVPVDGTDELNQMLPKFAAAHDFTVIDGAGQTEGLTGAAVAVADAVLIPVRPSAADLWGVRDLMDVIRARQEESDGKLKAAFVVSAAVTGANVSEQVAEALASFEGVPVLEARTGHRVAYVESMATGGAVLDAASSKAAAEIEAVTDELQKLLNQ